MPGLFFMKHSLVKPFHQDFYRKRRTMKIIGFPSHFQDDSTANSRMLCPINRFRIIETNERPGYLMIQKAVGNQGPVGRRSAPYIIAHIQ